MEHVLWVLIPLLVLSLTIFSWYIWSDIAEADALTQMSLITTDVQSGRAPYTVGFWGLHGRVVRFLRTKANRTAKADTTFTAGHWTL